MKIWKPLSQFYYSHERNEYKYHTDFALKEKEKIEVFINGKLLLRDEVLQGEERKYHFEMAVESFPEKEEETYKGVPLSQLKVGGTD